MTYISEFRWLFRDLNEESIRADPTRFLQNWLVEHSGLMEQLGHLRRFDAGFFDQDDLWSLYALSRVSDVLLVCFRHLPEWTNCHAISELEYSNFWQAMGMQIFYPENYHPFWCEIVEVEAAAQRDAPPEVVEWVWPGLQFGEMMFSRAGVRVRSGTDFMNPVIAEKSPLYFAFWRPPRNCYDLSKGWGSNSQWRTDFRRDYMFDGHYLFNVDGRPNYNQPAFLKSLNIRQSCERQFFGAKNADYQDLTPAEREELLVNRCFVRCTKDDEYWPYDDCFVLRRDLPLW